MYVDGNRPIRARVAVVGGGYGGVTAAAALDHDFDVVLIEPRDAFVHSVATLRAVAEEAWQNRIFFPYDRLLEHGVVMRDRAESVAPGTVALASGKVVSADYIVLASGSTYPFPAKMDADDAATAKRRIAKVRDALANARHVLLIGAGPVGLEFAGEITDAWPEKEVTLLDLAQDVLAGDFDDEMRVLLRAQLHSRGVKMVLGTCLRSVPPHPPGRLQPFRVTGADGFQLEADIWFRCHGVTPVSDYLGRDLARARTASGAIDVDERLLVRGQMSVFAVGDVTAVPEAKKSRAAYHHARVVAANIKALARGEAPVQTYKPPLPAIVVPLGRYGGAVQRQTPKGCEILAPQYASEYKGEDLMIDQWERTFKVTAAHETEPRVQRALVTTNTQSLEAERDDADAF